MSRPFRVFTRSRWLAAVAVTAVTVSAATVPLFSADLRLDYRPAAYAIRGATVVTGRGAPIAPGTVVVRDGVVEAVGPADKVEIPYDAETIDGKGLHVYPGFLDPFSTVGQPAGAARSRTGDGRALPYGDYAYPRTPPDNRYGITPEYDVASVLDLPDATAEERRRQGFTALVVAPGGAIAAGQSALASLSGLPRREAIVKAPVALHIALRSPGGLPFFESRACGDADDPDAVEAIEALQALARTATPTATQDPAPAPPVAPTRLAQPSPTPAETTPAPTPTPTPGTPSVPPNVAEQVGRRRGGGAGGGGVNYPTSLMGVVAHLRQAMLDAEHHQAVKAYVDEKGGARPPYDPALDALHAARTGALPVWWEANTRDEIHRALDLAEEFGTSAVIVGGREAWKVADRLKARGVAVVLRVDFPEEPKVPSRAEFRKTKAEERDEPLAVLEDRKARWKERVGCAAALAQAGVRFAITADGVSRPDAFHAQVRALIAAGLPADAAVAALTRDAAAIVGLSKRLGTIEPGKLGHLVAWTAPYGDEKARPRYVLADGLKFDLEKEAPSARKGVGGRTKDAARGVGAPEKSAVEAPKKEADAPKRAPDAAAEKPRAKAATKAEKPASSAAATKKAGAPASKAAAPTRDAVRAPDRDVEAARAKAQAEANEPPKREEDRGPDEPFVDVAAELEASRKPTIRTGGNAIVRGAKILTVTRGTVEKGNILIVDGKIAAVGPDVEARADSTEIDGEGLVALPGIIDTHSHLAIQGGVNEMSLSIVPEVRVKDVVTGDDPAIFRALAGGTTTARLLHGSANTIGGQDAVIKLKHGLAGRDLVVRDGPQGVKFALGENVTRRSGRFPNTRMGVEATIERAFDEGRAYRAAWRAYDAARAEGRPAPPPRRDLRLEALADVVEGKIKIHCHCYRGDEILMLLRVAERYGVRVRSLQHVLEGYKVAAEIAAHGASASTFSDWWAYKVEAYDAIPFNAALLTKAGVPVCIKSDSPELVRHLNLEAAKTIKYGGATEQQALEMVTINPARELGLDHRLGSLEPGKDADVVLFRGHPLDATSRCELALIDGEVWFQRAALDKASAAASKARPPRRVVPSAAAAARARALDIPEGKGVYALTGATVHPVGAPEIGDGTVIVSGGKIAAVGGPATPIPAGATSVDLKGLDVWPGMVDAGSPVGLVEIGSLPETQDNADSAQYQPELRTSTALHADSELIGVTRANGVLAAYVQPSGGVISGQGCVVQLDGWVPPEMTLVDRAALNVGIPAYASTNPDSPRSRFAALLGGGPGGDPNARRKEQIEAIKEQFRRALDYDKVRAAAAARKAAPPAPDPRMEALAPYARGEKLVLLRADQRVEILDAIKLARDLKLKAAITGGLEAWKVADELKASGLPVIVAGTLSIPGRATDPYDACYANPARLHAAGVPFAIRSVARGPEQATAGRNLPYEAATAAAFGLPEDEAVKAVTLYPARILGVSDKLGSIEVGKRANLVITAGHLLQPTTEVKALFIGGKPLPPESRHTRLHAKYARRLDEVKSGSAPLGLDRPAASASAPAAGSPPPAGDGAAGGSPSNSR